jgi:PKD repeat protein
MWLVILQKIFYFFKGYHMKFKSTLSTISFIVLFQFIVIGQINNTLNVSELFGDRDEIYFSFETDSKKVIQELSSVVSIDNVKAGKVFAYANKAEFTQFLEFEIPFKKHLAPGLLINPVMKDFEAIKAVNEWDFYPTYDAYVTMMYQFETDFPDLCEIVKIGESEDGRDILFARISDNVGVEEGEAQFMYTGTMHGDETAGYILFLRLIYYLLNNYGSNDQVDYLVSNLDIWINPLANPDGTYHGGNNSVYGAQRYNSNGVDLNRNYPDPEDGPHPDGNAWQAETIAFMQCAEDNHFVMSANTHGGAEVINYPWDTWPILHPDDAWWQYVCREYADSAQYYSPNGYLTELNNGITNGYAWYTTNGCRQDHMNYFHQCREVTMELSGTKLLPAGQLPAHWDYNYRSLLQYMEQSSFGLSGTITDAGSGNPLEGEVYISGHDMDSSWVYSVAETGKYFRLLMEGSYDVTFSADGYYPQTIEDISIVNRELTIVNVALEAGDLIPDFSANMTTIPIGTGINFTDASFGGIISWEWTFEGGTPSSSTLENPTNIIYNSVGNYNVSLTISDGTNSQTITKEDYITVNVEYTMQSTTVTTCEGIFYDSGGAVGNYGDDQDFTMTFLPSNAGNKLEAEFTSFNVEYESSCNYDWLKIYDGPTTSSSLIGEYCGTSNPGTITATNGEGALTFQFHSDGSVTESGWIANISCTGSGLAPVADFSANTLSIIEGESIVFTDESENDPTSWEWTFEGGTPASSTEQNPEVTYMLEGTYDVSLTVTNAYGYDTYSMNDYITVAPFISGIDNVDLNEFRVYPNPAKDQLFLKSDNQIESVAIITLLGETVKYSEVGATFTSLSVSDLQEGIYFLSVNTSKGLLNRKLQVSK